MTDFITYCWNNAFQVLGVYFAIAVIVFLFCYIPTKAYKDGLFGIVFAVGISVLWIYFIPAYLYEEYVERKKKKSTKILKDKS